MPTHEEEVRNRAIVRVQVRVLRAEAKSYSSEETLAQLDIERDAVLTRVSGSIEDNEAVFDSLLRTTVDEAAKLAESTVGEQIETIREARLKREERERAAAALAEDD